MERFVGIGEVVKAVGLRGEVKLYPLLDFHAPLLGSAYLTWEDGAAAPLEKAMEMAWKIATAAAPEAGRGEGRPLTFSTTRTVS